jgi:dTDP-4-amino-4,6-dideoxygalactose transaminase
MIPRLKPDLSWKEISTLFKLNHSDDTLSFEIAFAQLMGQRHAVFFPYGRTALCFLLEAMGISDKEVICPAYTCVVVPHAIISAGNEPVFVDSHPQSFNMDWSQVEEATCENTAAVIATSIFGHAVDLDSLKAYRQRHPEIIILQDCAHSYKASWKELPVQREGHAAFFGSNVSKIITSIFGGLVTTDDDKLADQLRENRKSQISEISVLRDLILRLYLFAVWVSFQENIYGITNAIERLGVLDHFVRYYDEGKIDMPNDYLLGTTPTQARVGQIQCERYAEIVENRRYVAAYYNENLQNVGDLSLPPLEPGATFSHYVPQTSHREAIMKHALREGVQIGQIIEYCIPEMPAYKDRRGCRFNYAVASRLAKETINLPISLGGSIEKAARVVASLKSFPWNG